jgi:hypothetical protein
MLKNLKSLFIVAEEDAPQETDSGSSGNKTAPVSPTVSNTGFTGVDEAILSKLLHAFEDNNQSGFDYLEFRQSLKAMAHLPLDESTKFQTAYATASAIGVTQEHLIASIGFYKKVLQSEEEKFNKASSDQEQTTIAAKKSEQEALAKLVQEKSALIQKLTGEILEHQKKIEDNQSFISEAQTKINDTQTKFQSTMQFMQKQLADDVVKLNTYLK